MHCNYILTYMDVQVHKYHPKKLEYHYCILSTFLSKKIHYILLFFSAIDIFLKDGIFREFPDDEVNFFPSNYATGIILCMCETRE